MSAAPAAGGHDKRVSYSGEAPNDGERRQSKNAPMIPKGPFDKWKLPSNLEAKTLIGTGSYGSVCEAYDNKGKRLVAIKRMGHVFDDLIDCKRILREVAILSKLQHNNVVKLYDLVVPHDLHAFDELYVVMEICDSDLKKLCRTDVTLSPLHINTLLYNLLVGLKYLHSAGIYHRDLKPANCLVNQDCSVKICDFGLARAIGEEVQPHLQELPNTPRGQGEAGKVAVPIVPATGRLKRHLTGHVVTRWYRAPELILLQENYTQQIDIWSVGCIYAELLGMLEGTRQEDRGPLFPGSSCFPLSPDHKHKTDYKYHTRGKHDQLNMIFNLLGTPLDEDIEKLERDDAKRYIRCFATREGEGLKNKFSQAPDVSTDILGRMLKFNPGNRISVKDALEEKVFSEGVDIRDRSLERDYTDTPIQLPFEKEPDLGEALLRKYFLIDIQKFHPEMQIPAEILNCT
jgi:mitogen-activated protein kinase 1/3